MKKIILLVGLFAILLSACAKEEALGIIKDIKASNVMQMLNKNESMILVIGTSTCESCIDFHKKMEKYVKNNEIMLYRLMIDNEPLTKNENGEDIRKDFIELGNRLMKIESTPTIIWIKNGEMVHSFIGNLDLKDFDKYNKKYNFI